MSPLRDGPRPLHGLRDCVPRSTDAGDAVAPEGCTCFAPVCKGCTMAEKPRRVV